MQARYRWIRRIAAFALCSAALSPTARADAVLDWNDVGIAAVIASRSSPPEGARAMAMMHVAMFEAANAVEGGYAPYAFNAARRRVRRPRGAAAAAAYRVLSGLYPQQRRRSTRRGRHRGRSSKARPASPAGAALGEQAAAECLTMRAKDGVGAVSDYRPVTAPGVYVGTMLPVSHDWREVKPFFLQQPSQFRPEPPPALTSELWARDYNEIKTFGEKNSRQRTPEQTEAARFWTATGAATWNSLVRALAASKPRRLAENARLFALVNMAATDAFVAVFDAKYAYNFWRPVTAIRNGDIDGNDATARDPGWLPFVDTPVHPEYPCAHCITAGAVAAVLEAEFGTGRVGPIELTSLTAPGRDAPLRAYRRLRPRGRRGAHLGRNALSQLNRGRRAHGPRDRRLRRRERAEAPALTRGPTPRRQRASAERCDV
jgi:hypothetical protein